MSFEQRGQALPERKLEHLAHATAGSSVSSENSGRNSPGAFFDIAKFWKGAEIAQPGVPSIIPDGGRALPDFATLGASVSALTESQGNSADGGSDFDQGQVGSERPMSPGEIEIGQWAKRAHNQDLEGSDNESGSAYSYASAVDLAAIDAELGLSEGLTLSPVTTDSGVGGSRESSPPPASDMPSVEVQTRKSDERANLEDMMDLRLDASPSSSFPAQEVPAHRESDDLESEIIEDGYVDLEEDNLGADGKHIYGSDGRQCSFAESFARRKGLGLRVASERQPDEPKSRKHKSKETSARGAAKGQKPGNTLDAASLIARAADALVELLDEKKAASTRLTEGTRAFSTVFTHDEKEVFGLVVRAALGLIRERASNKDANKFRKDAGKFELAKTQGGGQMVVHRAKSSSTEARSKKKRAPEPSLTLTQRVLLGTVTNRKQNKSGSKGSRSAAGGTVMLVTDGKVPGKPSTHMVDFESARFMTPRGPLTRSSSNETIHIQLPFASTLLSLLAVLARLDCELIFKRRKNRYGDHRRNSAISEHDCATVHARARQDRSNRHFTFSVVVQGSSPAKITFRRPKFIAIRRVDDYVDIVLDSKELMAEYCTSLWGQVPGLKQEH